MFCISEIYLYRQGGGSMDTANAGNEIYQKARKNAETYQKEILQAFNFLIENVDSVKEEAEKLAYMKDADFENYIKANNKSVLDRVVNSVKKYSEKMKDNAEFFPNLKSRADKVDDMVKTINDVLDKNNINGWGQDEEIVKVLRIWLLELLRASYKKPTLLGTLLEAITLPYAIAGMAAISAVCDYKDKQAEKKRKAVISEDSGKRLYRNHCWNCQHTITEQNTRCSECGWYICPSCGKCKRGCNGKTSFYDDIDDSYPETYELADMYDCDWGNGDD